jgi:hypothetical protein
MYTYRHIHIYIYKYMSFQVYKDCDPDEEDTHQVHSKREDKG